MILPIQTAGRYGGPAETPVAGLRDAERQPPGLADPKPLPAAWFAVDPLATDTGPQAVYEAARRYVAAGLSVIPIEAELGDKSPDARRLPRWFGADGSRGSSWSSYQVRRATPAELLGWRDAGGPFGLAVVGGLVSGGLEVIDFDTIGLVDPWVDEVERRVPGLVRRLVRIRSPRPGLHVYYRSVVCQGSRKLACGPGTDGYGTTVPKTLIEVKGEGGYCLVPPSPSRCHPTGRLYRFEDGSPDLTDVPTIMKHERDALLNAARAFNRWQEPERRTFTGTREQFPQGDRPGDDFNTRGRWADILKPHGWTFVREAAGQQFWRRPAKAVGTSATVNYAGVDLLHVFSSSAPPFEPGRSYTKFHAFALLNHGGDFSAAARALQARGFGRGVKPAGDTGPALSKEVV